MNRITPTTYAPLITTSEIIEKRKLVLLEYSGEDGRLYSNDGIEKKLQRE